MGWLDFLGGAGQGLAQGMTYLDQKAQQDRRNNLDMLDLALKAGDTQGAQQYATALHAPIDFAPMLQRQQAVAAADLADKQAGTAYTRVRTADVGWQQGFQDRKLAQDNSQFLADLGIKREDLGLRRTEAGQRWNLGLMGLNMDGLRLQQADRQLAQQGALGWAQENRLGLDNAYNIAYREGARMAGKPPDPLMDPDGKQQAAYNASVDANARKILAQLMGGNAPIQQPAAPAVMQGGTPNARQFQGFVTNYQGQFGPSSVSSFVRSHADNVAHGRNYASWHESGQAWDGVPALDQAQAAIQYGLTHGLHVLNEGDHLHYEPSSTGQGYYSVKPGAKGPYLNVQAPGAPTKRVQSLVNRYGVQ